MSCDFAVWFPDKHLSNREAGDLYRRLCEGEITAVQAHPSVDAFYEDVIAKHPEIDTTSEDRVSDLDFCPWSCALSRSPGHVAIASVWPKADYVANLVHELAFKHGLAVYDPQSSRIRYPDDGQRLPASRRRWWRFW